jgi:hypothetical protein
VIAKNFRENSIDRHPKDNADLARFLVSIGFQETDGTALDSTLMSRIKVIELAIAGNAPIIATNNLRGFRGSELTFPQLQILNPSQIIKN